MLSRYQTEKMKKIWSDETKYATWYSVELAYLESYLVSQGEHNSSLILRLRAQASTIDWKSAAARVEEYDRELKHDVIAFLHVLEDLLKDDARLIHVGLTSSDIVDTSFGILLKRSGEEITVRLRALLESLFKAALRNRGVLCLGRTHGQAAETTTFGIKLLGHLCEFARGYERLVHAIDGVAVGKFSGAVGVYGYTNPETERRALEMLGLKPETVATQVVARDRHAALFAELAVLAGSVERLAVEIRLLMHGQVREVFEPFSAKQKGSSAMPHKKNPVLSENLTGLMRLMRSYALASLENQALWHERDISHSSVERVIAPDAFHIMDFALNRLQGVIDNLVVSAPRMRENLDVVGDTLLSQAVMMALIEKGLMRQQAYELVQRAAINQDATSFKNRLEKAGIGEHLQPQELDEILLNGQRCLFEDQLFDRAEHLLRSLGVKKT